MQLSSYDQLLLIGAHWSPIGCDSGFGNKLSEVLDSYGFTVFATCLDPESKGAQHLLTVCSKRLKVVKLDVTKDEDVRQAVDYVRDNLMANSMQSFVVNQDSN